MFNVLKLIIERQRPLMADFRKIEARNGMKIVPFPMDLQSYDGQEEMRRLAWCVQEELCEACDAAMQTDEFNAIAIQEELIDALHFLAEFLIVTGYESRSLRIFDNAHRQSSGFMEVMVDWGMTINVLKNKPWKQTLREFDGVLFSMRFSKFLVSLSQLFLELGMTDEVLLAVYEKKHQVNVSRIVSGV